MKCATWFLLLLLSACSIFAQAGETKNQPSGWTTDTLKAHFDALRVADKELSETKHRHAQELRDAADKRYEQRFQAQEAAQLAYKTSANEFRGTLSDQAGRFISRSELWGYFLGLVAVMGVLVAWLAFGSRRRAEPQWATDLKQQLLKTK